MKNLIKTAGLFVVGLFVLSSCGGKEIVRSGYMAGAPTWVVKGSGAFKDDRGKVFYGVGSASGIRNHALLRSTSDNRARNELAKVLEIYTASLMKDYAASTTAADPNVTSEEQHVEQAIKTVTSATLSGVEIVDRWQADTGELFALARLDLDNFKDALKRAKDLNATARDYIRKNAERLHDELEKEEDKIQKK